MRGERKKESEIKRERETKAGTKRWRDRSYCQWNLIRSQPNNEAEGINFSLITKWESTSRSKSVLVFAEVQSESIDCSFATRIHALKLPAVLRYYHSSIVL